MADSVSACAVIIRVSIGAATGVTTSSGSLESGEQVLIESQLSGVRAEGQPEQVGGRGGAVPDAELTQGALER